MTHVVRYDTFLSTEPFVHPGLRHQYASSSLLRVIGMCNRMSAYMRRLATEPRGRWWGARTPLLMDGGWCAPSVGWEGCHWPRPRQTSDLQVRVSHFGFFQEPKDPTSLERGRCFLRVPALLCVIGTAHVSTNFHKVECVTKFSHIPYICTHTNTYMWEDSVLIVECPSPPISSFSTCKDAAHLGLNSTSRMSERCLSGNLTQISQFIFMEKKKEKQ